MSSPCHSSRENAGFQLKGAVPAPLVLPPSFGVVSVEQQGHRIIPVIAAVVGPQADRPLVMLYGLVHPQRAAAGVGEVVMHELAAKSSG